MFAEALALLAKKLQVKRDINRQQEKSFLSALSAEFGGLSSRMLTEYRIRMDGLKKTLKKKGKVHLLDLSRIHSQEMREAEKRIKGLVNGRERKRILGMLRERHQAEERSLKNHLKLEQDVEMEKLRKELYVSKRFAMKESQNRLLQDLIKEAKLNKVQADALLREHLENIAAVDKSLDDQKARQVMALGIRLEQRRALVQKKAGEDLHNKNLLSTLEEKHSQTVDELVGSAKLSDADIKMYRERLKHEVEVFEKKLSRDRQRQEDKLHKKLTARKLKIMDEKICEHQEQLKALHENQDDKFEQIGIDCIATIHEKHELLLKQQQEMEEIQRQTDQQATEELAQLQLQQSQEIVEHMKTFSNKLLQEFTNKGLSISEKDEIMERYAAEVARVEESRQEERRLQNQSIEKRLEKRRKELENKMKEGQEEQAALRKQEETIVRDLITNQVVLSENERERIMKEHEKNVAELESSLTLNKLRQRQMLEEKLAQRKRKRLENLKTKQQQEEQEQDQSDRIFNLGEGIELLRKHEKEKMRLVEDCESHIEEELDQIREEMMTERAKVLQEHDERLGALIAKLQIEKAKQVSQIAVQHQALGRLQVGLVDEMEARGSLDNPETQKIIDKHRKETEQLEKQLQTQRDKQEKALRGRLQERLKQREASLLMDQKEEISRSMGEQGEITAAMRFRRAAVKARHQKELAEIRNNIEKQIEQSLRDLRAQNEVKRLQLLEAQSIELISALVKCGNFQDGELESVVHYLFPTKSEEELERLLSQLLGKEYTSSAIFGSPSNERRISSLEERIMKPTALSPSSSLKKMVKKTRQKKKKRDISEDLEYSLPEIRTYGQGFNLNESLLSQSSPGSLHTDGNYSERSISPLSHDSDDQQLFEARDRGRKTKKSLRHHIL